MIVDEAHERSVNMDLLLGLLKQRLRTASSLRVVVTSATLDAQKFTEYFENYEDARMPLKLVKIPGRLVRSIIISTVLCVEGILSS